MSSGIINHRARIGNIKLLRTIVAYLSRKHTCCYFATMIFSYESSLKTEKKMHNCQKWFHHCTVTVSASKRLYLELRSKSFDIFFKYLSLVCLARLSPIYQSQFKTTHELICFCLADQHIKNPLIGKRFHIDLLDQIKE